MVGTFAAALHISGATLVLAVLVEPARVSEFALPTMLAASLMAFAAGVSGLLPPIASQLSGRDGRRLSETVMVAQRYSLALGLLICLGAWVAGPTILSIWLGQETMREGALEDMSVFLVIAVIGGTLSIPGAAAKSALMAIGRHWKAAQVQLVTGGSGLLLSIALESMLGEGPLVFAVALAGAGLAMGIWLSHQLSKALNIRLSAYARSSARVAVSFGLGAGTVWLWAWLWPSGGVTSTAMQLALVCLVFGGAAFWVVLEKRHRSSVIRKLRWIAT